MDLLDDADILRIVKRTGRRFRLAEQARGLVRDLAAWSKDTFTDDQGRLRHAAGSSEGGRFAPGDGGGGTSSSSGSLTQTSERAYTGRPVQISTRLNAAQTGAIGEDVITRYLRQTEGLQDARPVTRDRNNYAVDLVAGDQVIEAKTGLVSNVPSAQKWRTTIGEPGPAEKAWLRNASPTEKAAHNQEKMVAIMERKQRAVDEISQRLGRPLTTRTISTIINPDTRTADLYSFPGFHPNLRWNTPETRDAYVGSYRY